MNSRESPPALPPFYRYSVQVKLALVVLLPVLALVICGLLARWLEPTFEPPFIAAIALVAWLCGTPYAIAATALSVLAIEYLFASPAAVELLSTNYLLKMVMFLSVNAVIVGLIDRLFRSQVALAEAEQRHRSMAELIPFGGWTADPNGRVISLSESFLNTFGVTLDQARGFGWLDLLEGDREQVRTDWLECMRQGYFWDYEYRLKGKDGEIRSVLSRGVPLRDGRGNTRSWVGIHLDITEMERSTELRVEQARDIARFNAELEQLAYVASHDLQEPLRMIASYLQLLSRRYKDQLDAEAETFIDYAVDGANRLKSLLQDLMLLQQIGKSGRPPATIALNDVVEEVVTRLKPQIDETGAEITRDDLPVIYGQRSDFLRLFENLLENALKYRKPEVAPRIRVVAQPDGRYWKICITDNGIGIDPEYRERVFAIFQRLHTRAEYPGTGIGLAICKKIVEVHGGRLWVEASESGGSAFCLLMPVEKR